MATHARQQLRDAIKTVLTGLPQTGARVYTGRKRPLGTAHEPTLLVYTLIEESRRDANGNPPILARALTVFVEIRVVSADPPDDLLDTIAVDVEAAMASDLSFAGKAYNTQLVRTQQDVEASGESHLGGLQLEYRLTYRVREGQAATIV
jgi:hypothetical protein